MGRPDDEDEADAKRQHAREVARMDVFRQEAEALMQRHGVSGVLTYASAYKLEDDGEDLSIYVAPEAIGSLVVLPRRREVPEGTTRLLFCYADTRMLLRELESQRGLALIAQATNNTIREAQRGGEAWAANIDDDDTVDVGDPGRPKQGVVVRSAEVLPPKGPPRRDN